MPVADSTRRKQSKPYPELPLFAHRFLLGLIGKRSRVVEPIWRNLL